MRIIFAGTPEFSAAHLQSLIDSEHEIVGVFTQPDRPAGRGKALKASPVKHLAVANELPVFQPTTLKSEDSQHQLKSLQADVMVVVAYGLLLPQAVLDIPKHGCLNVHASLLPRWRGAAPIQRSIEAGDTETGITIMQMDAGLDTGAMLRKAVCSIEENDSAATLHDKLMVLGAPALLSVLNDIDEGKLQPETQNDADACYASKLSKQEAKLDWQSTAQALARQVRAFNPFPVSFFELNGQKIRVWKSFAKTGQLGQPPGTVVSMTPEGIEIACDDGSLCLTQLQMPGKKPADVAAIINGYGDRFPVGSVLQ